MLVRMKGGEPVEARERRVGGRYLCQFFCIFLFQTKEEKRKPTRVFFCLGKKHQINTNTQTLTNKPRYRGERERWREDEWVRKNNRRWVCWECRECVGREGGRGRVGRG